MIELILNDTNLFTEHEVQGIALRVNGAVKVLPRGIDAPIEV
jgi:hypothetical protein